MALIPGLIPYWNRNRLLSLVDRITARVQNSAWHRVRDRLPAMGLHEARGYIRARSTRVIDQEVALVIMDEPSLNPRQRDLIVRSVQHRIVRRLMCEHFRRQKSTRHRGPMAA